MSGKEAQFTGYGGGFSVMSPADYADLIPAAERLGMVSKERTVREDIKGELMLKDKPVENTAGQPSA